MKVFKDKRDGDILIMYTKTRYKWLSNPFFMHDLNVLGEVWDGSRRETFTRINTRYYYEQILL